jgi:glutaredoxin
MSKKTNIIIGIAVAMIIGAIIWLGLQDKSNPVKTEFDLDEMILFYGEGCPHCKDVEEYIAKNNIDQKVQYKKLEVWGNQKNAQIMKDIAKKCNLDSQKIGVPFLYADGECYIGGPDVEQVFKEKAGL